MSRASCSLRECAPMFGANRVAAAQLASVALLPLQLSAPARAFAPLSPLSLCSSILCAPSQTDSSSSSRAPQPTPQQCAENPHTHTASIMSTAAASAPAVTKQPQTARPAAASTSRPAASRGGATSARGPSRAAAAAPAPSAASVRDAERQAGRSFRPNESKQFALVCEFKPDWSTAKVLEFCSKHGFDEQTIRTELANEFECMCTPMQHTKCRRTAMQRTQQMRKRSKEIARSTGACDRGSVVHGCSSLALPLVCSVALSCVVCFVSPVERPSHSAVSEEWKEVPKKELKKKEGAAVAGGAPAGAGAAPGAKFNGAVAPAQAGAAGAAKTAGGKTDGQCETATGTLKESPTDASCVPLLTSRCSFAPVLAAPAP